MSVWLQILIGWTIFVALVYFAMWLEVLSYTINFGEKYTKLFDSFTEEE